VFDSFYDYDANIPAAEYDIVYSYFLSVMKTKQAAGNFTVSLFRVAEQTQISALTLLQQMQSNSGLAIDVSWPTISTTYVHEPHCWAWAQQWCLTFIKLEMYCHESLGPGIL
jgi:hypothetical protein